jgi:hypothetical protein
MSERKIVRRINGWTERGDEYGIEGGKGYVKDGDCYHVVFDTVGRIHEFWKVPAKDLDIEQLELKFQGPLEADKIGPFGRAFLEKYGKLIFQSRLPPKH